MKNERDLEELTKEELIAKVQQLEIMVTCMQPILEVYADNKNWIESHNGPQDENCYDKPDDGCPMLTFVGHGIDEDKPEGWSLARSALLEALSMGYSSSLMLVRAKATEDWIESIAQYMPEVKDLPFKGCKNIVGWLFSKIKK